MNIYETISLAVITVFYGIYAVKQVAMRREGIDTARLGKGEKPRNVAIQERILAAATLLVGVMQYVTVMVGNRFLPIGTPPVPLLFAGTVVCVVGVLYFGSAVHSMQKNWRAGIDAGQDTELVETGIYRFSRNPAFVGFDLLYLGFAVIWPNWPLALVSVLAASLFHVQILHEESYLEGRFGERYAEYRKRTLRY